ncbi:MAG: LacI family transcriptional regulator [Chloroflexota bacterium]|nr:LacI family transcriptional regulator [Chloroflexota bacterium]
MKDVALRANVSMKTVSNVVHDRTARVSPATRDRIRQAIVELDYRPNLAARQLRNSRVGIVALAIPTLENPYFATIARLIVDAGNRRGRLVLVDHTNGRREEELLTLRGLRPDVIDGIVFDPQTLNEDDIQGMNHHLPVVLIGERLLQAGFDHVLIDNEEAAFQATTHLLKLGRRRIAAIGVTDASAPPVQGLRFAGYVKALASASVAFDPSLVVSAKSGKFVRQDGADAMNTLIERGSLPDAIFCFNDLMAIGAMRSALSHGFRIPDDIAFIGIDDIEEGHYSTPSLSTIAPQKEVLASLVIELLIERIESRRDEEPRLHYVPFDLIARESTSAHRQ